ncbi:MAG: hypothetical protein EBZ52_09080 [Actinobacteria bacterium]|nr:hypothetical protein [Actinomycetota bacterium]
MTLDPTRSRLLPSKSLLKIQLRNEVLFVYSSIFHEINQKQKGMHAMRKMDKFKVFAISAVAASLLVAACGGSSDTADETSDTATEETTATASSTTTAPSAAGVKWSYNGSAWASTRTPAPCPQPLIAQGALLDFSKPVSKVQPGQSRGGSYKPHMESTSTA